MPVATYRETVQLLQPTVPIIYDALQHGLDKAIAHHDAENLRRSGDAHLFAHEVRRFACRHLMRHNLLATDLDNERSALAMSGIQLRHNTVNLWVFRGVDEVPLPTTTKKREFYRQVPTLDGWDNILLLWTDEADKITDPMRLVRPLGGDHRRRNLRLEWDGELTRDMGKMRVRDLDELEATYETRQLKGDTSQ